MRDRIAPRRQALVDRDGKVIIDKVYLRDPINATDDFPDAAPGACKLLADREPGEAP
jgi:hypothetical protein